jgi:hypothetical protein
MRALPEIVIPLVSVALFLGLIASLKNDPADRPRSAADLQDRIFIGGRLYTGWWTVLKWSRPPR